jgi:outer membrane receptor protein involved in Fe transport
VTNPILFGLPEITITGLTQLGGNATWPNLTGPNTSYDFVDHLSYLHGKHAFKFGGEIRTSQINQGSYRDGKGKFAFTGGFAFPGSTPLEDFLAGTTNHVVLQVGDPQRNLTQWGYAGFLQDDWRVTPKVTLNLGLRYEYSTPWSEAHDLLGNWQPTVGLEQVGKQISSPYNGDHKDFAPRLGER